MEERRSSFVVGPAIALASFATSLAGTVILDLIVYRTCQVSMNINDTKCIMLRTNASSPVSMDVEAKVQPYTSLILMINSLIEIVLLTAVSLFLGSWSDRNGRKPLLLLGLTGFVLMYGMLALMCIFNVSPWYLIITTIPTDIMGGIYFVKLAGVCYVTDTASEKAAKAPKVFSFIMVFEIFGSIVGTSLYTLMYSNFLRPIYPSPVYLISITLLVLSILCVAYMEVLIRNSRKPPTYTAAAQDDLSS